jgi:tetratricopeptide (TPR) repeat protein
MGTLKKLNSQVKTMSDSASQLMTQANQARREHRLADARRDLVEAVALCRHNQAPRELIQALKGLAQIDRDMGHEDAALPLYEEAVVLCREQAEPLMLAHTVRHLGDVHRKSGHVQKARACYDEALALYRSDPQTSSLDLANAIRPMALVMEIDGQIEDAKRLWQQARDLYAAADVAEGVTESSARLARLDALQA